MTDALVAGETWRRQINIADATGPVDPTDVTAVMCPEIRLTLEHPDVGVFVVSLTESETAHLPSGDTPWELWGRVGADLLCLTRQSVRVWSGCGP